MNYTISYGAWDFYLYLTIENYHGDPVLADLEITEAVNRLFPADELTGEELRLILPRLEKKVEKEWPKIEAFLKIEQDLFKAGIV